MLQQADMEHIVKTRSRRQGEAVRHRIDDLRDLVRPEVALAKLVTRRTIQRRQWPMKQTEPHPVTHLE